MTTLETLLKGLDVHLNHKALSFPVTGIACHSKQVKPGDLFIAMKGSTADGASYIAEALKRGAKRGCRRTRFSVGYGNGKSYCQRCPGDTRDPFPSFLQRPQ